MPLLLELDQFLADLQEELERDGADMLQAANRGSLRHPTESAMNHGAASAYQLASLKVQRARRALWSTEEDAL